MSARRLLGITENCLEEPTYFDLAVTAATMLWPLPSDEKMGQQYAATVSADQMIRSGVYPPPATRGEHNELVDLVRWLGPRVTDVEEPIKEGFRCGAIAGRILRDAVASDGGLSLSVIKKAVAKSCEISVRTVDDAWLRYKCVATFWAAHFILYARDAPIPCRAGDFALFLAVANDMRKRAEAIRIAKATAPILGPGDAVAIPQAVEEKLPRGTVRFSTRCQAVIGRL